MSRTMRDRMYRDVLVPTDGSEHSMLATEHGIALADRFDAAIHALSVVPAGETRDQLRAEPEAEADDAVESLAEEAQREGIEVTRVIRSGVPNEEIVEYADESDVDLIVMSTHGRTGIGRVAIGSVAEQVVRNSPVPVMTVRSTE